MADDQQSEQDRKNRLTASDVSDFFSALVGRLISGVLSPEEKEPWREHVRRLRIGAAGGLFYAFLKNYINAGIGIVGLLTMDPSSPHRAELFFGYCVGAIMSAMTGAVAAWLSAQKSGRLLFLIGMGGVLIFLSLFPGLQSRGPQTVGWLIDEAMPITPAYAQNEQTCVGDSAFAKGFKAFFGVRDYYDKYAVVVASGASFADAQAKMVTISAKDSTLKLRVGPRACDNDYYPVFASDYLPLSEAKALLDKIRKSSGISDAYLSPGPLYRYYD